MKKIRLILGVVLLCSIAVFWFSIFYVFSGAGSPKEYSDGFFKYRFEHESKTEVSISGLTTLGKQQKFFVIPTEINGKKVKAIYNRRFSTMGKASVDFKNDNLEKVFFPANDINIINLRVEENVKILFVTSPEDFDFGKLVKRATTYIYQGVFDLPWDLKYNEVFMEHIRERFLTANVTYYVNCETDINNGVHWIDDVEYDGLIEFIPPTPIRDGYTFDGWYKEAECINIWDFSTDKTPVQILGADEQIVYQETKLFAKWV